MPNFYFEEAFGYYDKHINRKERFELLKEHNFSITGSVPSIDWELFGSILTGDSRKDGYGSDLGNYEIKSATRTGSFEYQYHLHGGLTKLKEDMAVDHIFISYSPDYADATVRLAQGDILAPFFQRWKPALIANYSGEDPKQRFRRSIAYGTVAKLGAIIMKIEDGRLVFPIASNG